ncbi:cupin domain-containing protein, partial [candidate division GN15 bacterium]
ELLHPRGDYAFDGRYSLAHAVLAPEKASAPHWLKSCEVYYILSGEGEMHIDSETALIGPGDAVVIPAESMQWLRNTGAKPLTFLCIVDPAWRAEDEVILD